MSLNSLRAGSRVLLATLLLLFASVGTMVPSASARASRLMTVRQAPSYEDVTQGDVDSWDSMRTFRLTGALRAPLRVFVDTHSSYYKPALLGQVSESLKSWSQALDGRLRFVLVDRRQNAEITVDWVANFHDNYTAGMTNYGPGFAKVEIRTQGIPDKDIRANIMHELGHGLGIASHSPYAGDIMQAVRRWQGNGKPYEPTLSSHDVQAIKRLYSTTWQRGENLYSANAQNEKLPTIAFKAPSDDNVDEADDNAAVSAFYARVNTKGGKKVAAYCLRKPESFVRLERKMQEQVATSRQKRSS